MNKEQSMYAKYFAALICLILFGWNFLALFWRDYVPMPYENSSRATVSVVSSPTRPLNMTCAVVFFVGMITFFVAGINDYNSSVSELGEEENCTQSKSGTSEVPPSSIKPTNVQATLIQPNSVLSVSNVIPFVRPTADGTEQSGKLSPEEFRSLLEDPWEKSDGN